MKNDIILFDLDGIYKAQNFYDSYRFRWLNIHNLKGTNMYCDKCAQDKLREKIKSIQLPELTFIGSGNYHYISYFLTEKIKKDFTLILFDNHTDMQKPIFEELLSCGSWVRVAMKNEVHLKQIILLGTKKLDVSCIDKVFRDRVTIFDYNQIHNNKQWRHSLRQLIKYPVYISVDKDVFSKSIVSTNWDQGEMNMEEFVQAFEAISLEHRVIGMDVCGEYTTIYDEEDSFIKANEKNNEINHELVELADNIIE